MFYLQIRKDQVRISIHVFKKLFCFNVFSFHSFHRWIFHPFLFWLCDHYYFSITQNPLNIFFSPDLGEHLIRIQIIIHALREFLKGIHMVFNSISYAIKCFIISYKLISWSNNRWSSEHIVLCLHVTSPFFAHKRYFLCKGWISLPLNAKGKTAPVQPLNFKTDSLNSTDHPENQNFELQEWVFLKIIY